MLELNGEDLRPLPFAQGEAGNVLARTTSGSLLTSTPRPTAPPCSDRPAQWASKAIVSQRLTAPYRSGVSRDYTSDNVLERSESLRLSPARDNRDFSQI
jgi:hypothetical protein